MVVLVVLCSAATSYWPKDFAIVDNWVGPLEQHEAEKSANAPLFCVCFYTHNVFHAADIADLQAADTVAVHYGAQPTKRCCE